jgi:hypothetical protein
MACMRMQKYLLQANACVCKEAAKCVIFGYAEIVNAQKREGADEENDHI